MEKKKLLSCSSLQLFAKLQGYFPSHVCGNKTGDFKPKKLSFPNLHQVLLSPNVTKRQPQRFHNIILQPSHQNKLLALYISVVCRKTQCRHLFWWLCCSKRIKKHCQNKETSQLWTYISHTETEQHLSSHPSCLLSAHLYQTPTLPVCDIWSLKSTDDIIFSGCKALIIH